MARYLKFEPVKSQVALISHFPILVILSIHLHVADMKDSDSILDVETGNLTKVVIFATV
jgi:hypothetical protein